MSLKLPSYGTVTRTLSAWATELRNAGVVTAPRATGPRLCYLPEGSTEWEARTPAKTGQGWKKWDLRLLEPAAINFSVYYARYRIFDHTLFFQAEIQEDTSAATWLQFNSPANLATPWYLPGGSLAQWSSSGGHYEGAAVKGPLRVVAQNIRPNRFLIRNPSVGVGVQLLWFIDFMAEIKDGT